MKYTGLAGLLTAAPLISTIYAFGTTVQVAISYCPAPGGGGLPPAPSGVPGQ